MWNRGTNSRRTLKVPNLWTHLKTNMIAYFQPSSVKTIIDILYMCIYAHLELTNTNTNTNTYYQPDLIWIL